MYGLRRRGDVKKRESRCCRFRLSQDAMGRITRKTVFLFTGVPLAIVPLVLAQDSKVQPAPDAPPEALGQQLVVWSEAQKPQPLERNLIALKSADANAAKGFQQIERDRAERDTPPSQPQPTAPSCASSGNSAPE
jgi:hypothetical protein